MDDNKFPVTREELLIYLEDQDDGSDMAYNLKIRYRFIFQ